MVIRTPLSTFQPQQPLMFEPLPPSTLGLETPLLRRTYRDHEVLRLLSGHLDLGSKVFYETLSPYLIQDPLPLYHLWPWLTMIFFDLDDRTSWCRSTMTVLIVRLPFLTQGGGRRADKREIEGVTVLDWPSVHRFYCDLQWVLAEVVVFRFIPSRPN